MRAGGADTTIGNAITFIDNPTFTTVASEKSLIFTGNASLGATRTLTVETGSTDSAKFVEFSGEISGSGFGITKAGTGNLVLSGTNTYDGETVIKAGTLKANTSTTIGSSSKITVGDTGSSGTVLDATAAGLTVGATQTLAGIGTVDATGQTVTIVGTGTLAPGNSAGTLSMTVGNLDLGNSTALAFELNPSDTTVGSSINDLVDVTGNLNLDGLLSVVATSGDFLSVVANTSWRLFNYSGTLTDDTLSLGSMPSLGSGLSWSIDTATTGQVNLVVIPEPRAALLGGLGLLALLRRRRR
jgi:autotransporter-associated beta strand protein